MPFLFGKKSFVLFLIIVLVAGVFSFGFYLGKSQSAPAPIEGIANQEIGKPEAVDFSLFWDAWRILQDNYVDKKNLNLQKMVYGAISGMVSSLGDPYTVFFPPEEAKIFKEDVSGEFQGLGIEIGIKKGELTVIAPLEGSPAQKAGLRTGDIILKVNNADMKGVTIDEAVKMIRGPKGTDVTLTIFRKDWEKPKDFKITRDVIAVPSLKWELLASPTGGTDNNIAYIRIYQFSEKAGADFSKAAQEILSSPAQKIIIDVRDNPGGYLEVVQDISGWLLKNGEVVAIEDFGQNGNKEEFKARGNGKLLEYPVIILINQGSASGSEILAGALRDNRGIKLIGETSFGKGSVQELKELKSDSSLKITIAKWLTPKGSLIAERGLDPDIKVEITEKDHESGRDPQMDKALEIIKGL